MFGLFSPRYLKNGEELLQAACKMLRYKRDLLSPADLEEIDLRIARLKETLRNRDRVGVEEASKATEQFFSTRFPAPSHPDLRENCEVFLVAIIIASGIRAFYLQPFTIPTGSMQPTLNGIIVTATENPLPNPAQRAFDLLWKGRSHFRVVSQSDDTILGFRDVTRLRFFSNAELVCENQRFAIPGSAAAVMKAFPDLTPGTSLKAGQVVACGYADTGDHVFVNKMAYNFRAPSRGEVFVFSTAGIPTPENRQNPGSPSQYYIKRLAGLPGDELRIDPPNLFVNGEPATGAAFKRVMSGTRNHPKDGYYGYGNGPDYLNSPDSPYRIPEKRYFALGDNSYNSADSRYWGTVPQDNLMGCGLFVYWPFNKHWGLIK